MTLTGLEGGLYVTCSFQRGLGSRTSGAPQTESLAPSLFGKELSAKSLFLCAYYVHKTMRLHKREQMLLPVTEWQMWRKGDEGTEGKKEEV